MMNSNGFISHAPTDSFNQQGKLTFFFFPVFLLNRTFDLPLPGERYGINPVGRMYGAAAMETMAMLWPWLQQFKRDPGGRGAWSLCAQYLQVVKVWRPLFDSCKVYWIYITFHCTLVYLILCLNVMSLWQMASVGYEDQNAWLFAP